MSNMAWNIIKKWNENQNEIKMKALAFICKFFLACSPPVGETSAGIWQQRKEKRGYSKHMYKRLLCVEFIVGTGCTYYFFHQIYTKWRGSPYNRFHGRKHEQGIESGEQALVKWWSESNMDCKAKAVIVRAVIERFLVWGVWMLFVKPYVCLSMCICDDVSLWVTVILCGEAMCCVIISVSDACVLQITGHHKSQLVAKKKKGT